MESPRDEATVRVAPPDQARRPAPRRGGSAWPGAIGLLIATPLLVCGFELVTSLAAARINGNHYFLLAVGLGVTLLMPLSVALSARRSGGARRRQPSGKLMVALFNLLLIATLGLAAPTACARAIDAHGSWWVAAAVGLLGMPPTSAPVRASRRVFAGLAAELPGASPARVGTGHRTAPTSRPARTAPAPPPPPPPAADPPPAPSPSGPARVKFERRGSSILVPVALRGPTGEVRAKMIFDTGATLSTIDRRTAEQLGIAIDPRDPTIVTHTANGKVRRTLKVVESISVAGARVAGGLAVTICDPCASSRAIGLLGLNFSRHFAVTFDHEGGELVLKPRTKRLSHLYDIRAFVEIKDSRGLRRGPQMTVKATIHNRAGRALHAVRVVALVGGKRPTKLWTEVPHVPPRGSVPVTLQGLLKEGAANSYRLSLDAADW